MFGCYRKGDANDPETYVAAITATLARYPEDVIRAVTHPASGLPIQKDFLPTVAEVYRACEAQMKPRREQWARQAADAQRKREREEFEARKNTPEQDEQIHTDLKELAVRLDTGIWPDEATGEKLPPASEGGGKCGVNMNCEIICVTADRFQSWRCVGATRDEAEKYYNAALTSGASWVSSAGLSRHSN